MRSEWLVPPPPRGGAALTVQYSSTALYTEAKFRRWTLGKWVPPRDTIAFRLGVLVSSSRDSLRLPSLITHSTAGLDRNHTYACDHHSPSPSSPMGWKQVVSALAPSGGFEGGLRGLMKLRHRSAWTSGVVIGTFVGFGALVVIFTIWEWKFAGKSSILPLRFFRNRTQVGAMLEVSLLHDF